jgi:hypothetical protein
MGSKKEKKKEGTVGAVLVIDVDNALRVRDDAEQKFQRWK